MSVVIDPDNVTLLNPSSVAIHSASSWTAMSDARNAQVREPSVQSAYGLVEVRVSFEALLVRFTPRFVWRRPHADGTGCGAMS